MPEFQRSLPVGLSRRRRRRSQLFGWPAPPPDARASCRERLAVGRCYCGWLVGVWLFRAHPRLNSSSVGAACRVGPQRPITHLNILNSCVTTDMCKIVSTVHTNYYEYCTVLGSYHSYVLSAVETCHCRDTVLYQSTIPVNDSDCEFRVYGASAGIVDFPRISSTSR